LSQNNCSNIISQVNNHSHKTPVILIIQTFLMNFATLN